MLNSKEIITRLKKLSNSKNVEGMARFGINPKYALGIKIPTLRKMAKEIKQSSYVKTSEDLHTIANKLWCSKIHEARILAGMIDVQELVTNAQMDSWIKDFNSWDLCDQTCMNLFAKLAEQSPSEVPIKSGQRRRNSPDPYKKVVEWASSSHFAKASREYQRRAGFALMAVLAWHDKSAPDLKFLEFFPYIKKYSTDERNYVKKAVNWALRQIGKRNKELRIMAINIAKEIIEENSNSKSAQWIAKDALKELNAPVKLP